MAAPGFGHGSYVQCAREATWGTKPTITRRWNVVKSTLQGFRGKVPSDALTDTRNRASVFSGPQKAIGELTLEADFAGQLLLWDAAMGTATYASDNVTPTGTYIRAMTQKALFNSLSFEEIKGPIPAGKCNLITGAKINTLKLSGTGGEAPKPLSLVVGIIGKQYQDNQTPTGALTANSPKPMLFSHIDTSTFTSGVGDSPGMERLRSFEFAIDNKLTQDRWYGADTIDEPLGGDFATTSLKVQLEFATKSSLDVYIADTAGVATGTLAPYLKLTNATEIMVFSFAAGCIMQPIGAPIDKYGIILQDFTVEALGAGPTITITNSDASIA